jgi:hypothetical protein
MPVGRELTIGITIAIHPDMDTTYFSSGAIERSWESMDRVDETLELGEEVDPQELILFLAVKGPLLSLN